MLLVPSMITMRLRQVKGTCFFYIFLEKHLVRDVFFIAQNTSPPTSESSGWLPIYAYWSLTDLPLGYGGAHRLSPKDSEVSKPGSVSVFICFYLFPLLSALPPMHVC